MAKLLGKWIDDRAIDYNHILLSNEQFVLARNFADTLDLTMFKANASDQFEFGIEPIWNSPPSELAALTNKEYVDSVVFGMRDPKDAVRVVGIGNVNIASAPASLDGVTLNANDRVGLIAQTDATENGIYIFNGVGLAMTRSLDADSDAEVTQGMSFFCAEGTNNSYRSYALVTPDPITLGVTALSFVQVPSLGNILLFRNPVVTLGAPDITNGYIDLANLIIDDSFSLNPVGGVEQEFGVDYTLADAGGFTRITFAGDLAAELVAGDKLSLKYTYQP